MLVSQTSFRGETVSGVAKWRPFPQAKKKDFLATTGLAGPPMSNVLFTDISLTDNWASVYKILS